MMLEIAGGIILGGIGLFWLFVLFLLWIDDGRGHNDEQ